MDAPLKGIRILDLTWVLAGPFSTMVLCDLGAEVVKLERLNVGDISRSNGPHINGLSMYFLSLNRGKKSLTLNLATAKGKEIFLKLVPKFDVIVENFVPGTMKKLGLDYSVVKEHNPRIIYAACSGFGQSGPSSHKPALDIIVQSMGGVLSITGEPGRPPVKPGVSMGDIAAGLFMAVAILTALRERDKSGLGQMIDISMLDCQVAIEENAFVRYLNTGAVPKAIGNRHAAFTPFQTFPTKDSYIAVATMGEMPNRWPVFCTVINRPDIKDDERFRTGWLRTQHYDILEPIMNEALRSRTTEEWIQAFEAADIPCGPVNSIDKVAADPQVNLREMFVDMHHPQAGDFKVVGTPVKLSRTPCKPNRCAPDLGEHSEEILKDLLSFSDQEIADLKKEGII
jgi:CoA:oxalate CoA-transferase